MFWTTPKKIALTILLAVLFSWLFGCAEPQKPQEIFKPVFIPLVADPQRATDLPFLYREFRSFNDEYFNGRLAEPEITLDEPDEMATTLCEKGHCIIRFNLKYTLAPRTAQITLLHEMCHEAVPDERFHGKKWVTCMLKLDMAGAFREVIIDNYQEPR